MNKSKPKQERAWDGNCNVFYKTNIKGDTPSFLPDTIDDTDQPQDNVEGVNTRCDHQEAGIIGHHLEAVYRHNKIEKHNAWTNDKSVSRSNYVHLGWKINE